MRYGYSAESLHRLEAQWRSLVIERLHTIASFKLSWCTYLLPWTTSTSCSSSSWVIGGTAGAVAGIVVGDGSSCLPFSAGMEWYNSVPLHAMRLCPRRVPGSLEHAVVDASPLRMLAASPRICAMLALGLASCSASVRGCGPVRLPARTCACGRVGLVSDTGAPYVYRELVETCLGPP